MVSFLDYHTKVNIIPLQLTILKGVMVMKILRVFDQTTGFNELYEGYLNSQLQKLIEGETQEKYNEDTTHITPRNEVVL
jgi:hypothetical protein